MKIAAVETFPLVFHLDRPVGDAQGLVDRRPTLLVKVSTDDGAYGWGEASGAGPLEARAIQHLAAPLLIGENPMEVERIYHKMARPLARAGRIRGMLDNTLWDLKARIIGVPLASALGGALRDRIPAYASLHNYWDDKADLTEDMLKLVNLAKSQNFQALKLKIGGRPPLEDIGYIRTVRKALGPARRLMVDGNQAYDPATAVRVGRVLDAEAVTWFEEPVLRHDLEGYFFLRQKLDLPIAGGEGLDGMNTFMGFVRQRAVDIIQPDLTGAGGITGLRAMAATAAASDFCFTCHCWNVSVQLVATAHFLATLPAWRLPSISPEAPPLEMTIMPDALRESLLTEPLTVGEDGCVGLPTGPGLGVDVNPEALQRFAVRD
jgi:D-galactarolactone cycloisomerase